MTAPVRSALLAACLLALPALASAQTPQPTPVAAAQPGAVALAKLTCPRDLMVEQQIETAKRAFYAGFRAEPEAAEVEAANPGMVDFLWAAIRPEMESQSLKILPKIWTMLAEVYSARLTAREIDSLRAFYATPTGQKVVKSMYSEVDVSPVISEMVRSEGRISDSTAKGVITAASNRMANTLTAEDLRVVTALVGYISREKMRSVSDETRRVMLALGSAPDPELDARLAAIIDNALARYLEKRAPAK
jgi:hypothetical protein